MLLFIIKTFKNITGQFVSSCFAIFCFSGVTVRIRHERSSCFLLFQSYGFPLELTEELAQERGVKVDSKGFQKEYVPKNK